MRGSRLDDVTQPTLSCRFVLDIQGQKYKGRILRVWCLWDTTREETAAVKTKGEPRGLINHLSLKHKERKRNAALSLSFNNNGDHFLHRNHMRQITSWKKDSLNKVGFLSLARRETKHHLMLCLEVWYLQASHILSHLFRVIKVSYRRVRLLWLSSHHISSKYHVWFSIFFPTV